MSESGYLWTTSDSGNRISDQQRDVLKRKTGFEGYTAYLEDYSRKHSGYEPLLTSWRSYGEKRPQDKRERNSWDILDLIKDENSLISLDLCCRTASNSQLFTALSEPRKGVYGRIVIWRTDRDISWDIDFLEDLGLVLKISPAFLKSLYAKCPRYNLPYNHIHLFAARHIMVRDTVATMTRCRISEESTAVPIALIADPTALPLVKSVHCNFEQPDSTSLSGISKIGEMIMGIIERNSFFSQSADALILPTLLAAIHLGAYDLRGWCDHTLQNHGKGDSPEVMSTNRIELHRTIEDFEDVAQDALMGLRSLYGADWSQKYECESSLEYFTETINRARRLEAYVRDVCQAQTGQLSLEESRKSIELSFSQIEEGKRVKIFTILAFVYVPLNLASSIFGMNIQQLNNSGQSIQTFLITAVIILLLTGGCWLCTEEVNQYRSWSHRRRTRPFGQSSTRSAYSIAVRIRLLVWLYCNGHWAWARTTKAWWYILANSRADPDHGFGSQLRDVIDELDRDMSAGEYVSAYMTYNWSAPFQTSSGWNKKKEETA